MFRRLAMAIFRLYMKYLIVTRDLIWAVYSGEVGVEVDTRSRMRHGGWEVWVSAIICISRYTYNSRYPMYPHLPTSMTRDLVSTSTPASPLYTTHIKPRITAYQVFHVQPEDGHCQAPKHVVVPYVVNTIYNLSHQIKLC